MTADTPETTIPADDVILRGYCGPVRALHPTIREWELTAYAWGQVTVAGRVVSADGLTLEIPLEEAEARDHVARVMAEGCAPIEHLMDRPGSRLTAAQSAVLVAWSYQSWRGGGAVLRGLAVFIESTSQGARAWRERGDLCSHDSIGNPRTFSIVPVRNSQECYDAVVHELNYATVHDDGSVTLPELPTETK